MTDSIAVLDVRPPSSGGFVVGQRVGKPAFNANFAFNKAERDL